MGRPVYDAKWQPAVRIQNFYTLGADSGLVRVTSSEYLESLQARYDGRDTTFNERKGELTLKTARPATVSWLSLRTDARPEKRSDDSLEVFTRRLELHSLLRPVSVNITYSSDLPFVATSPWASGGRRRLAKESDRLKMFSWYSFPDTNLVIPVTFSIRDTQQVRESIEVTYDSLAYPVTLRKENVYIISRTIVNTHESFGVPGKNGVAGM
jgi:hypothetical protein